jgi:glycosyltransferase involved in cell wall biosynthesis
MMVRLSICIATYNRGAFIGQTLDTIVPQLTDEVELLIVDGASTDNTQEIVEKYVDGTDRIRYIRLPIKGGVDQDYDKAVGFASGEMCWLFTDDDLLKVGAVSRVLKSITERYGLIVVNAEVRNKDFSRVINERRNPVYSDIIINNGDIDRLFQSSVPYLSFIGGVVIKRSIWLERKRETYYGTEFIHMGVIFQAPLELQALVLSDPLITIRFGNAQWTARSLEIWLFKWPNMICSFDALSQKSKKDYKNRQSFKRLKNLLEFRAGKTYNMQVYRKLFSGEKTAFWWKAVIRTIAILPSEALKFLIVSYLRAKKSVGLEEWL